jgi:DNA-binding beta-propeller fold protein YncE
MAYVLNRGGQIARLLWDDDGIWDTDERAPLAGGGDADGKFTWPVAMIIDRDDNLFVSDEALHRITSLTTQGEFLAKWGDFGEEDGQLNRPSGIAFDADENIYVSDTLNHRVQRFTKDGRFLMKWGRLGDGDGEFNMPWGITVDELGDVYVADWRNDRVQKFTADGEFIFKLGRSGSGNGELNRPAGVAVDPDGDIYVADSENDRVQLFNADGRYVEKFIGDATLSVMARDYMLTNAKPNRLRDMADLEPQKRFRNPRSVRVDDKGRMYVPDFGSFRVQVYQKEVVHLSEDQISPPFRAPMLETT